VPTPSPEDTIDLPPLLDCDAVKRFLDEHGIGSGPVDAAQIGEGHSNVTYRVRRDGACVVLRRPPRPPLPPSAHDVLREARVLRGLEGSGVPVPRVLATCEDDSLLGVPFYVMEFLDGVPMTTTTPPGLRDPAHRAAMAQRMISALATLHGVDFGACGLGDLGRPEGYLERQVRRFADLWKRGRTRELPELDEVTAWLRDHLPESGAPSIVHGDFRIGNLLYCRTPPVRLLGIVDWEMATLGDPLADVGYLCAHLAERGDTGNVMTELQPVTREEGFPDSDALAHRYAELTGRSLENLGWYRVLAVWKSAIFLEQSYNRFLSGTEHDPWFAEMDDGVPRLVARARVEAGLD
jgi:aminoglycoside phosphotransferase (APT) family kinase protein